MTRDYKKYCAYITQENGDSTLVQRYDTLAAAKRDYEDRMIGRKGFILNEETNRVLKRYPGF